MRYFPTRAVCLFAALAIVAGVGAVPALAQNPITAAREAYRKAQEDAKRQREEAQRQKDQQGKQPAATQPAAQPPPQKTPAQNTPAPPAGSSQPVILEDLLKPEAPANVTLGDPKAMPDIVGIHLHMPLQEAVAIVSNRYPKKFAPYEIAMPTLGDKIVVALQITPALGGDDTAWVDVTLPPEKQVVWGVGRSVGGPGKEVNRAVLLAALREKYGKESSAFDDGAGHANGPAPASNDNRIYEIWWLFDEQGRRLALPSSSGVQTASGALRIQGCAGRGQSSPNFSLWEVRGQVPPVPDGWVASSCVAVHVRFSPYDDAQIIRGYTVDMVNIPLALRASKATTAWWKTTQEKLRQQEVEKSKQAKPTL